MAVLPSARRSENRRQMDSGNLPQSSSDSKARNLRSHRVASRLGSEAVAARSFGILLCDATMHSSNLKPLFGFPRRQETDDFFAELDQRNQPWPRHGQHLRVPAIDQFGESQHFLQPPARNRTDRRIVGGVDDAGAQRIDGGGGFAVP